MKISNYLDTFEGKEIYQGTKKSMLTGKIIIIFTSLMALLSYLIDVQPIKSLKSLQNIYWISNFLVVVTLIIIFSLKKSIYFSSKYIDEKDTLKTLLIKWSKFDIILMLIGLILPFAGFFCFLQGINFVGIWHFYLASILLTIMIMPMGIKVRSKLKIIRTYFPNI